MAAPKSVVECMKKYQKQVRSDIKAGKQWRYYNSNTSGTFAAAVKNGNRRANCATIANWALRQLGVLVAGQYFYGKIDNTLACSQQTLKAIKAKCKVIHVNGKKTVNQCIKDGTLQPGDIVTYWNLQHTNVYAGDDHWYDAGHAYCKQSGQGARFITWYGSTIYGGNRISYIIHYKKTVYRVRVGIFTLDNNVINLQHKILDTLDLGTFTEKKSNGTHVYCGSFEDQKVAQERVNLLKKNGFDAKIITTTV